MRPGSTDLFAEAARQGMPALAMTDHGNVFGAYDFYKQAKARRASSRSSAWRATTPRTGRFDRQPFDFGGGVDEGVGEDERWPAARQATRT